MFRSLLCIPVFLLLQAAVPAGTGEQVSLANVEFRADERVFAVMCALHAAGNEEGLAAEPAGSLRRQIIRDLELRPLDAAFRKELRDYYERFNIEMSDSSQQVKYASLAVLLGPAPDFEFRPGDMQPPASLQSLAGFSGLLARYYALTDLGTLWRKWRPAITAELNELAPSIRQGILDTLRFANLPAKLYMDRRLVIMAMPACASGLVATINLTGTYTMLVSPRRPGRGAAVPFIHQYLHYLLDPQTIEAFDRFDASPELRACLHVHAGFTKLAARPGQAVHESLINALQAGVIRLEDPRLADQLEAEMIVEWPFVRLFRDRYSLAEAGNMVEWAKKELAALTPALLCQSLPAAGVNGAEAAVAPPPAPVTAPPARGWERAEILLQEKKWEEAEVLLTQLLARDPAHAAALFGLGQIRFQQENFPDALAFFDRARQTAGADLWIRGWSLVRGAYCMQRLGQAEAAVNRMKEAAALAGDTRGAAEAAKRALEQSVPNK